MGAPSPDLAVFILTGGKSTRMGREKAFAVLDGKTLLARALELGRGVTSDVRIVGDAAKFRQFAPVVEDVFRDCGPLGGIHAALGATTAGWNLMLAVDSPFVTPTLLNFLAGRARASDAVVTVPRSGGRLQPLCAVYGREFAEVAEKALRAGRCKIDGLFEPQTTLVIAETELQAAGFAAALFRNINTPEQLACAAADDRRVRNA